MVMWENHLHTFAHHLHIFAWKMIHMIADLLMYKGKDKLLRCLELIYIHLTGIKR